MNFVNENTKSGVSLYVLPMPQAHTVATGVLINVGSRDERIPEEAGLAHAFEHMFMQGTKRFPNKRVLSEYIEEIGGLKNAFTTKEFTFFYNQLPFVEFERSIIMLSEQIQQSLLLPDRITSEMQVIVQEINRTYDIPTKLVHEKTWEHIFKNHPLGHMVLGTKDSVLSFKRDNFLSFMERFYYPGNYTFIIAGNISTEKAKELLDKHFRSSVIKERNNPIFEKIKPPSENRIIIHRPINQAHINLAAPVWLANKKEKVCLDLFAIMAGSGSSSPLYDEIRNKRGLCYTIYARFYPGIDTGIFIVNMATETEKYEEAIKIAFSVLEETKNNHIRLDKAKKMKLGKLALDMENPLDIIHDTAWNTVFFGKPQGYNEISSAIKDITIEDIKKTVDRYLKHDQFNLILLMPEGVF